MYPLNTIFPSYGEQYDYSPYPPYSEGLPYGNIPQYSSQPGISVCQWQPTMPVQPRLVNPTQLMKTMSVIATMPIVTTVAQPQIQTVVSQPIQTNPSTLQSQVLSQEVQISQVFVQQPLVSRV